MGYVEKLKRHGISGSFRRVVSLARQRSGWDRLRHARAPEYHSPHDAELEEIEANLERAGIEVTGLELPVSEFRAFLDRGYFPSTYHGGPGGGVWLEKQLEHWLAWRLLGLEKFGQNDIYVDVAAASSPWAKSLREREGVQAYAIDLATIPPEFRGTGYYRTENATQSTFADKSVRGASLQCAFEMFNGDHDIAFIRELDRILAPNGKAVILPLYMHTHYCAYSTPEYFGKGYADADAKEYIRFDTSNVPSSRKYDALHLKSRVIDVAESHGLRYRLSALRNKRQLGSGVYCHFVLEIFR